MHISCGPPCVHMHERGVPQCGGAAAAAAAASEAAAAADAAAAGAGPPPRAAATAAAVRRSSRNSGSWRASSGTRRYCVRDVVRCFFVAFYKQALQFSGTSRHRVCGRLRICATSAGWRLITQLHLLWRTRPQVYGVCASGGPARHLHSG